MPWRGKADVQRHNKKCAQHAGCRSLWLRTANKLYDETGNDGQAVIRANVKAKKWLQERGKYRRRHFRRNPRRGPGQPGHSWLKSARKPLHYLRTEISNTSRTLDQIKELLDDIQQNIGGLRKSEFNHLIGDLLLVLEQSDVVPMLTDLEAELRRISASTGLRPVKRQLIDIASKYSTREQRRLRDIDKSRDRAMSYPWVDIYSLALGLGGEVHFVSDDRRLAGFVVPKNNKNEFLDFINNDSNYEWKEAKHQRWLLKDQPALIIVECLVLRSEAHRKAQIQKRKDKRTIRRRKPPRKYY